MVRKRKQLVTIPLEFIRANPTAFARFDPNTKQCTMNCGPTRNDPRSKEERLFLCDDCLTVNNATETR